MLSLNELQQFLDDNYAPKRLEDYTTDRIASLQGEIDELKAHVAALAATRVWIDTTAATELPKIAVTVTDIPAPADPKPRKSRAKAPAPVEAVPVALLSDDEVQVAASAPEPVATHAPVTRIVTSGELIAAVQIFRATHGIESARAMWARVAPNKNKISEVTDAERPAILDAVNAEAAHAAK